MAFKTRNFTLILSFIVLFHMSFASPYHCHHDKLDLSVHIHEEHPKTHTHTHRRALQETTYQNIQIYPDFSLLPTDINSTLKDYIQNDLIAQAIYYYQQTLMVVPRGKNLTSTKQTICGLNTPAVFQGEGVAADLGLIIDVTTENSDYVAYARACVLSSTNNRPIFGNVHLNLNYLKIGTILNHEQNLNVALHEMAHVFGISKGLFEFYYNPDTGRVRTGHIKQKVVNGVSAVAIDLEPLTSKLKEFYGCSQIDGVLMENQGDAASTNSHLERRIFFHEIMTASEIEGARISDFMLAFLEGTGWYKGNYSMTEPLYWGKDRGCDFYYGSCMTAGNATNPPEANYEEYCSNIAEIGCSADRRYAAICGGSTQAKNTSIISTFNYWGDGTVVADMFADNCPYFETNPSIDCQDPSFQGTGFLNTEVFGAGSKCFTGNLGSSDSTKRTYCLKASCEKQSDSSYFMKITLGNIVATCKESGSLFVDGYDGAIDCPDPNEYCSTFGSEYCSRGCMGKGQCVKNTCQCDDGWGGNDCSTKVYKDKCDRCSDNILETACYGDGCSEIPVLTEVTASQDDSRDSSTSSSSSDGSVQVNTTSSANYAGNLSFIKLIMIFGMIMSIAL